MPRRDPPKCIKTFEQRLADEARRFREAAEQAPQGSMARELLLRRARQADTASHLSEWLKSSELQPPKSRRCAGFFHCPEMETAPARRLEPLEPVISSGANRR